MCWVVLEVPFLVLPATHNKVSMELHCRGLDQEENQGFTALVLSALAVSASKTSHFHHRPNRSQRSSPTLGLQVHKSAQAQGCTLEDWLTLQSLASDPLGLDGNFQAMAFVIYRCKLSSSNLLRFRELATTKA